MKCLYTYIVLITILLSACGEKRSGEKRSDILTFELKRSHFTEKIDAPGTVQAVNTISLSAPRIPGASNLTVIHLVDDGSYVKKGDTICVISSTELSTRLETNILDLETNRADMKKLEADNAMNLSMLEAQIENNNAQVALNSLDSVQQKFAPPVKQKLFDLELKKSNVIKAKLQKKFDALKKISDSDIRKMNSRIAQSENLIMNLKNQLLSLKLVAPIDGMVLHVISPILYSRGGGTIGGNIKEGSSVFGGMTVLQIPDRNEMQVTVEVPEADYKRIEENQKVLIEINAANKLKTTGTVKKKTLMGQTNRFHGETQSKIKTYEVIVKVDSCHNLMTPGLSADCDILISSVRDTLVIPTSSIFQVDSTKVVYVATDGKFFPVTIETGLTNSSETIVSNGLSGNEVIALVEPPHNLIQKSLKEGKAKTGIEGKLKSDSLKGKTAAR